MRFTQYYLKSLSGKEIYAVDELGNEFYAVDESDAQYYAKNEHGVQYFAKDASQHPIYAEDDYMNDIYPINEFGDQYYIIDEYGDEIYARDVNGYEYYAKNRHGDEYYTKINVNVDNGRAKGECYAYEIMTLIYAKRKNGSHYYAKNFKNEEYSTSLTYAVNHLGDQFYPKNEYGDEVLFERYGMIFYAKDKEGNEKYPRKRDLNEYYPRSGQTDKQIFPVKKNRSLFYATSRDQNVIFPKDENGEKYIYYPETESVCLDGLSRYALSKIGAEIYPVSNLQHGYEIIINNRYALDEKKVPMYPLDSCGNEYLLKSESGGYKIESLLGYPISNDGFVIIPEGPTGPEIDTTLQPKVNESNIVRKMVLDSEVLFGGFLSNVKGNRKPRVLKGCKFIVSKKTNLIVQENPKVEKSYLTTILLILLALAMILTASSLFVKYFK